MPKIKFFAWLLLVDRLNTRQMLRRRHKHLEEGYLCVLCPDRVDESSLHLLFECQSSIARWQILGIQWQQHGNIIQKLQHQKAIFNAPFFMDLFMIAAWAIWKERNDYIFNSRPPSIQKWKQLFKTEVNLHLHRLPPNKRSLIMDWTIHL